MRFGLIANFKRPDAMETVQSVVDWCKKHNHETNISDIDGEVSSAGAPAVDINEISDISDIVISLGGDGTLLTLGTFDVKDGSASTFWSVGSQKRNVLPSPSTLVTQIAPPCISTSCFEMARPRPVPP